MVIVRVQGPDWEVVAEVRDVYGDAAAVARRLREEGLAAVKRGNQVIVNANADRRTT